MSKDKINWSYRNSLIHEGLVAGQVADVPGANLANESRSGKCRSSRSCRSSPVLQMRIGQTGLALRRLHRQEASLRSLLQKSTCHKSFPSCGEMKQSLLPARCTMASRSKDPYWP